MNVIALWPDGAQPMRRMSGILALEISTLTRNLPALDKAGIVEIGRSDRDRRVRVARLTNAGKTRLAEALPLWIQAHGRINAALGDETANALNSARNAASLALADAEQEEREGSARACCGLLDSGSRCGAICDSLFAGQIWWPGMGKLNPVGLWERVVTFVEERHSHRSAAVRFRVLAKFVNDMVILKRETGGLEPRRQGNGSGHGKLEPVRAWLEARMAKKGDDAQQRPPRRQAEAA
ncbi:MAG: hypothetical protein JJU19_00920 [Pararhodobacter sp.]|nr:hypothetical protein [Pararhodobacter sp.]